jgi:hypothetical protein
MQIVHGIVWGIVLDRTGVHLTLMTGDEMVMPQNTVLEMPIFR